MRPIDGDKQLIEDTKRPNGKHEHLTGRPRKRGRQMIRIGIVDDQEIFRQGMK